MSERSLPQTAERSGFFITFEGGEGAGKSTQIKRLADRLNKTDLPLIVTREPGGSNGAEAIRELLVTGTPDRWSASTETLLNFAARDDHLARTIRPALGEGKIVLCDRFMDSTRAYQGTAGGAQTKLISDLETAIIGQTKPNLTFIFDLDPQKGLDRTQTRNHGNEDRYEGKPLAFHHSLRQAFLDIATNEPQRCTVINADQTLEKVAADIWCVAAQKLGVL